MDGAFHTQKSLIDDLVRLGIRNGDGVFVHASMGAIGRTIGGPRAVIETLLSAVGTTGLLGMPGFSTDAYFPLDMDRSSLTQNQIAQIEAAVPGYDVLKSPASAMGIIAETFRHWPGTQRSSHPTASICLNGPDAADYLKNHSLAWATGDDTPLGKLCHRPSTKVLLIGVGWNRCSALHVAETLASHRRTKTRHFKNGGAEGEWVETPDVADDLNRLFPAVGAAFEDTGAVTVGLFGNAECRICDLGSLVHFARDWIDAANLRSGDRA